MEKENLLKYFFSNYQKTSETIRNKDWTLQFKSGLAILEARVYKKTGEAQWLKKSQQNTNDAIDQFS